MIILYERIYWSIFYVLAISKVTRKMNLKKNYKTVLQICYIFFSNEDVFKYIFDILINRMSTVKNDYEDLLLNRLIGNVPNKLDFLNNL